MTSGSDDYDSHTGLDVNALSSSQRWCGFDFAAAKIVFFFLQKKNTIN
jgi:hypothetical protein